MLRKKNQGLFLSLSATTLILCLASSPIFAKEATSDSERVQKLFDSPTANSIVQAHKQRIANIDFEIEQVTNLINQYGSFQQRINNVYTQENQRVEMKKIMDQELDKYWKILEKLKEARELLEQKPSFQYIDKTK